MKPTVYSPRSTVGGLRSLVYRPRSTVHGPRPASAFTLVELLVVIVVIAILMGITLPVSKYAIARAKAARQEVVLSKIRSALDDYRAAYGEYPITPDTNHAAGTRPSNYDDAIRHYPDNYPTYCYYTTNSPYTNVYLASSGTVEQISTAQGIYYIDYGLTYPLMLKQLDKGARQLMDFTIITVLHMVYRTTDADKLEWSEMRRGGLRVQRGIYGNPVKRAKAVDPVSGYQWKYVCPDGINYELTTNSFR